MDYTIRMVAEPFTNVDYAVPLVIHTLPSKLMFLKGKSWNCIFYYFVKIVFYHS